MVNFGDKQAIAKLTLLLIYKIAYPKNCGWKPRRESFVYLFGVMLLG